MNLDNINNHNLPSELELEQLANQFFKLLPGVQAYQNTERELNLQESFTERGSNIPKSIAGSGISPSLTGNESHFNIEDPQTSLPDPHFYEGIIPQSLAGSGKSGFSTPNEIYSNPFGYNAAVEESLRGAKLPFEEEHGFEKELKDVLRSIATYSPTAQFSTAFVAGFADPVYYFLNANSGQQVFDNYLKSSENLQGAGHNVNAIKGIVKPPFDVNFLRADFPILKEKVNGKPLIWFDNAATTQKPTQVIERLSYYYQHENSNIHRAAHELAARSTDAFEAARKKIQLFLNAKSPNEIIFVRGTTEAINLVAQSWGDQNLKEGDEIILSHLEHHANIVPWQLLAAKKGLKIRVIPVDDDGQVILEEYAKLLNNKTKLVSFTWVSNALGTITPAKTIIDMAHSAGAKVLLDGAQSVAHIRTDLQYLNPDWFVFSGHKVFAPTGIGVLYGKEDLLNQTQPWQGGGNMIADVTFEHTQYQPAPNKFEAGTANIADAVGLGAAIDYINRIGIDLIYQYEHALLAYATQLLKAVPGLRLIGTAPDKTSVLSFVLDGYKNEEVGQILNKEGIAVRTGHHCAQPILRRFGLESTVRPSLAFYNTCTEVDTLVSVLHELKKHRR